MTIEWRTRWLVAVGAAIVCLLQAGCEEPDVPSGPLQVADGSIILISIDTLRGDMLGSAGYSTWETSPFLDDFSREAITFERCIVPEPFTLPSHMSLFTGLAPHNHGVQKEVALAEDVPLLAEILKESGFRTQGFVSGGYLFPKWGFARGFDDYATLRHVDFAVLLDQAADWLRAHAQERYFLFLHTYDVHSNGAAPRYESRSPYAGLFSSEVDSKLSTPDAEAFHRLWAQHRDALVPADKAYLKATYAEGVRQADDELRHFFDFLKTSGVYDRATLIVWSDHGEGLVDHERWGHRELYDHTIRVPLMIRRPGGAGGPAHVRSVVSALDIMPTILELAGIERALELDGRSLLPLLAEEDEQALAFSKLDHDDARGFSVRSATHHLIWDAMEERALLFDLRTDPEERVDLFGTGLAVEKTLWASLSEFIAEHDARIAARVRPEPSPIDAEVREHLRALGYLD